MKCAVIGMLNGSPMEPPAVPPITAAILRTTVLAIGIQVGFGLPCPCREVRRHFLVPGIFLGYVVIELSSVCITRATTVRSDQCFRS